MNPPRTASSPKYSLDTIKELTLSGNAQITKRAFSWLLSHYPHPEKVIEEVISQLQPDDFWKSIELRERPGTVADVYIGASFDDSEWYVKVFIADKKPIVHIWSMAWDGSSH